MTEPTAVRFLDRTTPPHIMTLVLLAGIGAMNMSAFLPSLPAMSAYFDTPYSVIQLSVSLYLATTAMLQLLIGPLADRFGRRPVVLWALALFTVATVGCILAPTVEVFLAFRMMQGVVAAGFVLSRAIVRDIHPQNEAASMIGYVTMGMSLVPMFAPMIGGALDKAFGWQATFVFLAVSGLLIWLLAWADQGETVPKGHSTSFRAQIRDYPELLRSPRFWGYVFAAAFASGAFFAFLGGAPYVASEVYGLDAFWAGVGFGAPAIGYAVGNFLSGRFSVRTGVNRMILYGTLTTSLGLAASVLITGSGYGSALVFFGFCTFVGLGNGMVIPNAAAGMLSVRPRLAGTASGLGGAIQIGGGALLSVLAGIVLLWGTTSLPLQILMLATSLLSLASIHFVIRRERRLPAA
jgi:DHA1 family bicyclomycin/chloramphenicol resistance-like MFS transporter